MLLEKFSKLKRLLSILGFSVFGILLLVVAVAEYTS